MSEFELMDRHFVELEAYGSFPVCGFADEADPLPPPSNDYIITIDGDVMTLKAL